VLYLSRKTFNKRFCTGILMRYEMRNASYRNPLQGIMKRTIVHIILFVLTPIIIGGLIYLLTRSDSLLMFDWLKKIGLAENITIIRSKLRINDLLQNWIIYNSPAWIWTFSLTVLLGIIWNYKINKESLTILLIPSFLGVLSEILQQTEIINGTYDFIDLFLYLFGGISGLLIIKSINYKHKFNVV